MRRPSGMLSYMPLDVVNACFELVACVLCWRSVMQLRRDREVRGIFWPQVAWSGVWGLWCLPYYVGVGHMLSFGVACVRELGTFAWVLTYAALARGVRS